MGEDEFYHQNQLIPRLIVCTEMVAKYGQFAWNST